MIPPWSRVGKRPRTKRFPNRTKMNTNKASSLIDQAQDKWSSTDLSAIGNTIPPKLVPVKVIPVARPLLALNQWDITESATVVNIAPLIPPRTPKHRRNCQYFVHWPRSNKYETHPTDPTKVSHRGPYRSKSGPICTPRNKVRKTWVDEIQLISWEL